MASQSPSQSTIGARVPAGATEDTTQARQAGVMMLRKLALVALVMEGFFLALWAVAPLGGVTQSRSPLVAVWPWLLAPARMIFGETLVAASVPPADGWLQLALFALLLVGAAIAAAWGLLIVRRSAEPPYALAFALGNDGALRAHSRAAALAAVRRPLQLHPLWPHQRRASRQPARRSALGLPARPVPADGLLARCALGLRPRLAGALRRPLAASPRRWAGASPLYTALFKLLGVAAHLLNAWLVWLILGRLAPKARLLGTLFYAWSPLCLLEFGASAHNDALMLTFLLLGVYCLTRGTNGTTGWDAAAMVAFGFSIATKYVPLALIPLYFALVIWTARGRGASWRGDGSARWPGVARCSRGTILLALAPYWAGPQTINALLFSPPAQQLDNSLLESLSWPLRWLAEGVGLSHAAAKSLVET